MGCGGSKPADGDAAAGAPSSNVPTPQAQGGEKKDDAPERETSRRREPAAAAEGSDSQRSDSRRKASKPALQLEAVKPSLDAVSEDKAEADDEEPAAAAVALVRKTLEGNKKALGDTHASTLTSMNNLASLLQDEGSAASLDEAEVRRGARPRLPLTLTSLILTSLTSRT